MSQPTAAEYLSYANLQMAAESFIRDENNPDVFRSQGQALIDALVRGNDHASKFVVSQAAKFAEGWQVLDQMANTSTGFSGTLFRRVRDDPVTGAKAGETVLSFRSTEFIDDAARDNKATNVLEIKETGFAWGQIADMQAWYAKLKSDPALLGSGQAFSVTGYSLGGHLATVFNLLNQDAAQRVVTFNGAGVGRIQDGTLQGAVNEFNELRGSTDALAAKFTEPGLADIYRDFQAKLGAGTMTAAQAQAALKAHYSSSETGNSGLTAQASMLMSRAAIAIKIEAKKSMNQSVWRRLLMRTCAGRVKPTKKPQRFGACRHPLACLTLALAGCVGSGGPQATTAADGAPVSKAQQQPLKERQRIAAEMFRERCKKAGVFIHRAVDNVDGVFLMKIRPDEVNFSNQYVLDDPYGSDVGGDSYIRSFLKSYYESWKRTSSMPQLPGDRRGYEYVEAIDAKDGVRYRYSGSVKATRRMKVDAPNVQLELKRNPNFDLNIYDYILERTPSPSARPRYGVTYDDISTREERDYWIAGSSLKVIDLETDEVIAERIGYMVDWAQGVRVGGRSPWLLAANNACPEFAPRHGSVSQLSQTIRFVNKSLKPRGGE
ncbi:hypothetical protein M5C97_24620 [Acidovorax sp. NCPPB 3859]|nr:MULTISPECIES: hypothetical protein [unclassified Acidovorax]MDA8452792.1 hypothetical protein [Acidovorax sp. GBBC 3297]MDA8462199.1 hypothetical protein [Acidovorax sp. GBBC 3333]MDA8467233.1 hypothetical protein [Acidovorax sp. GBBC 3332]MDA8472268.1 hypothetical protein [Acidovorax sp. GBBC 3299]WCM78626.1 hypothetical protein M5C94_24570 [Acidovorax sp. GBBC 712]